MRDNERYMHDSGQRREFGTGSVRDRGDDKPRPDLISPHAIMRLGAWMGLGAKKYGEHNWELGQPVSSFVESLERHLYKYKMGMTDEDHMAAVMYNTQAVLHFEELAKQGDMIAQEMCDRYASAKLVEREEEALAALVTRLQNEGLVREDGAYYANSNEVLVVLESTNYAHIVYNEQTDDFLLWFERRGALSVDGELYENLTANDVFNQVQEYLEEEQEEEAAEDAFMRVMSDLLATGVITEWERTGYWRGWATLPSRNRVYISFDLSSDSFKLEYEDDDGPPITGLNAQRLSYELLNSNDVLHRGMGYLLRSGVITDWEREGFYKATASLPNGRKIYVTFKTNGMYRLEYFDSGTVVENLTMKQAREYLRDAKR